MDILTTSTFTGDQRASPVCECDRYAILNTLRYVAKNIAIPQRDIRSEICEIRKFLLDGLVADALLSALPTPYSHHELEMLILRRGLRRDCIIQLLRKTTRNRVRSIEDLTEREAMVVWHLLGGPDE